jgi:hypothetical protein
VTADTFAPAAEAGAKRRHHLGRETRRPRAAAHHPRLLTITRLYVLRIDLSRREPRRARLDGPARAAHRNSPGPRRRREKLGRVPRRAGRQNSNGPVRGDSSNAVRRAKDGMLPRCTRHAQRRRPFAPPLSAHRRAPSRAPPRARSPRRTEIRVSCRAAPAVLPLPAPSARPALRPRDSRMSDFRSPCFLSLISSPRAASRDRPRREPRLSGRRGLPLLRAARPAGARARGRVRARAASSSCPRPAVGTDGSAARREGTTSASQYVSRVAAETQASVLPEYANTPTILRAPANVCSRPRRARTAKLRQLLDRHVLLRRRAASTAASRSRRRARDVDLTAPRRDALDLSRRHRQAGRDEEATVVYTVGQAGRPSAPCSRTATSSPTGARRSRPARSRRRPLARPCYPVSSHLFGLSGLGRRAAARRRAG